MLLLPETSIEDGLALLNKLRNYIADCNFRFQDIPVPVTMSCGIAEFSEDDCIEDVFYRADQSMYLAKHAGRNQCRSEADLGKESIPAPAR